ncbi:hypothetical protein B7494_g2505 [Chlorociboria aeruginascens]|nr:hypothetical protein B7494_g2505 [Chlorociboria aeruginascens]
MSSKRPRLSLQTPSTAPQALGKSATALVGDFDPTSPTTFNTLSNAYAVAIGNSSPMTAKPSASFDPKPSATTKPTSLRLQTSRFGDGYVHPSQRTQTPGPFQITYPDTPSSAHPGSTPTTAHPSVAKSLPPGSTFTPPQSAGSASEQPMPKVFTFSASTPESAKSPRTPRRRATFGGQYQVAPYTHPRSLHSILRNSPLPPRSTITPATPTRMSARLANREKKKVGYNDPLTQTITTNKYLKSHIELLLEDSPSSATDPELGNREGLDAALSYTGDETRDGGQTPGPFEEMRRRLAESELETPDAKKRRRKEKKRKWRWTIGGEEAGDSPQDEMIIISPGTTIEKTPLTSVWPGPPVDPPTDSEMSEEASETSELSSDASEASETDDRPTRSQSL